ncbi:MAG: hypothetical protein CVU64_04850, partial [Deltaproteobacteria bacterium HGW-Deltaproteobacteria-21]
MKSFGIFPAFFKTAAEERPEIIEVRHIVFGKLMKVILRLGFLAVLLGSVRPFLQGRWIFAAFCISIYGIVLATTLTRDFPLRLRSLLLVSAMFFISVASLVHVGLSGPGML